MEENRKKEDREEAAHRDPGPEPPSPAWPVPPVPMPEVFPPIRPCGEGRNLHEGSIAPGLPLPGLLPPWPVPGTSIPASAGFPYPMGMPPGAAIPGWPANDPFHLPWGGLFPGAGYALPPLLPVTGFPPGSASAKDWGFAPHETGWYPREPLRYLEDQSVPGAFSAGDPWPQPDSEAVPPGEGLEWRDP